jgi:penicillin-binding protein 1B
MAGRTVQGASTLTQQLVKNFYLSQERTLERKLNEAYMALLLDYRYDKDEILTAYANEVYMGQDGSRGIHGFGLASRFYFDRDSTN